MTLFPFTLHKTCEKTKARLGTFSTPHGNIETPTFMPVGTRGVVKTLTPTDLNELGADIILANTYHLAMRPGEKLIAEMGGLHKWTGWDKPILTDSGGFQIFSLKNLTKITDEGVSFKSHLDGQTHFFTPEKVIEIQNQLGSDIIMVLDECAPADSSKSYALDALKRTHSWALRCQKAHKNTKNQALFPIIQGVVFDDLRITSAKFMADLDLPGIAIGGLSVGESLEVRNHILETIEPHLPTNKPRYLMGVGTPRDLIEGVARGIDLFDCVLPTRLARHGAFWSKNGRHSIRNEQFKKDAKPLDSTCSCSTCQNFSASYLRHLITENEITGHRLLTIHNLHFLLNLMREIRKSLKNGTFYNDFCT